MAIKVYPEPKGMVSELFMSHISSWPHQSEPGYVSFSLWACLKVTNFPHQHQHFCGPSQIMFTQMLVSSDHALELLLLTIILEV